jgi:hypothetical protein
MAAQGSIISSADYNGVVDQLTLVLGSGAPNGPGTPAPNYGYNQPLQSTKVTPGTTITADQWKKVQNDLGKVYLHQTGTSYVFTTTASKTLITYSDLANLSPVLTSVSTNPNAVALNQLTQTTLATITYNNPWGGGPAGITTTATVSFPDFKTLQYFLNQGGKIVIQGTGPNQNGTKQNESWDQMLRRFNYTLDINEWTAFTQTNAPGKFVEVFKISSSYYYTFSGNYVSLNLMYDSIGTLYFTVTLYDTYVGLQDSVNSGAGFIIYQYSASGAFTGYAATAYSKDTLAWSLI